MIANELPSQKGQSVILVAVILLGLVILAAITVDISSAYGGRRTAQNAADAAAVAAAQQLGSQINHQSYNDGLIHVELNDFAERNGIPDTDGVAGNAVNSNVAGVYLDEDGMSLGVSIGSGSVPNNAWGVEATAYITTPSFFGGVVGMSGYPLQAVAAVLLDKACGADCVVPIATSSMAFTTTAPCYNIWNGTGPGNFGWLNWSWQKMFCHSDDCSAPCLVDNLDPNGCPSGFIRVGDLVAGTTGVSNDGNIRKLLEYYIDTPQEFTTVVWQESNGEQGCGSWPHGLHYEVAGLARMQLLGYQLSHGQSYPDVDEFDPSTCLTLGVPPRDGNRLSARFVRWVGGGGGNCRAIGSLRQVRIKE